MKPNYVILGHSWPGREGALQQKGGVLCWCIPKPPAISWPLFIFMCFVQISCVMTAHIVVAREKRREQRREESGKGKEKESDHTATRPTSRSRGGIRVTFPSKNS